MSEFNQLTSEQLDAYVFWGMDTDGVDLSDSRERDRLLHTLLKKCFNLRRRIHGHSSYFDPAVHAIVIETDAPLEQQLLNFAHEISHVIASQNIFGRTLQAFSDLQDVVYKALEPLQAIAYVFSDLATDVVDLDTLQFSDAWQERGEQQISHYFQDYLSTHRGRVLEIYGDPNFRRFRDLFQRLANRRRSLTRAWRLCQEGFATYKEVHDGIYPPIADLAIKCFGLAAPQMGHLADIMAHEQSRKRALLESHNPHLSRTYHDGYALFRTLAEHDERYVFLASSFSCHFPYHACDLVECSDLRFHELVDSCMLNVDMRLRRLAERPSILKAVNSDRDSHRGVLEFIIGQPIPKEISLGARCFDSWEAQHIRGANSITQALGLPRAASGETSASEDLRFHLQLGGAVQSLGVFSSDGALLLSESRTQGEVLIRRMHDMAWLDYVEAALRAMEPFAVHQPKARESEPAKSNESPQLSKLGEINEGLFGVMESFPRQRSSLLDFWTKHTRDDYVSAATSKCGLKIFVQTDTSDAVRRLVPVASILGETVLFDCIQYAGKRTVSMFPIPDSLASPVLYASGQDDSKTGRRDFAKPQDLVLIMAAAFRKREDGDEDPFRAFGVEPFTPDEPWTQTPFFRTSKQLKNDVGEQCSLAVGITHLRVPEDDKLLEDSRPLLVRGNLAYFPFLQTSSFITKPEQMCSRVRSIGGTLTTDVEWIPSHCKRVPIARLSIPFIAGAPYDKICQSLASEWNAFTALRGEIELMTVGIQSMTDPCVDLERIWAPRRVAVEEELRKAHETLRKITRSKSLAGHDASVLHASLSVDGILGLSPPSLGEGAGVTFVEELCRNYAAAQRKHESVCYVVWHMSLDPAVADKAL